MSSSQERLAALSPRLQSITRLPDDLGSPLKLEEFEIDPTNPKYVCAECAWTTSANAGILARHFTAKHTSRLKCPHCKCFCANQEELEKHRIQKHRHLCPRCQQFFATVHECKHHEPCERENRIATTTVNGASLRTVADQPVGGKAPDSGQSVLNRKGSIQSGSCPDTGCQLTFPDFETLYEHYVRSHPLYIVYPGHSKPFKCPFCSKRYQYDRFVPGHVRTHKPKSLSTPGMADAEDQEALIQQSRLALADRESKKSPEAQAQANRISSDDEQEHFPPVKEEDEYSLMLEDSVVYIDHGEEPLSPLPEEPDQPNQQEPQRFRETTPIGFLLQASPTDLPMFHPANVTLVVKAEPRSPTIKLESSDLMDLADDYPERFALEDDEVPSTTSSIDSSISASQLFDGVFHQSLSRELIRALQMQHFINVSEVVDLFAYFLDHHQRIYVLEQLAGINLDQHDSDILEALHGTVFKALIDAWVHFKRLAIHFAPQLIIQANNQSTGSGKSITWALLQYCLNLESLIYRNEINIAHHFLRDPPLDDLVLTLDTPFPRLVAALAERIKNRTVQDSTIVFTNEMILREMSDYVRILQMVFRPLYPLAAGHERLWRELRLI